MSASVVSAEEVEVVGTILEGAGLMPVVFGTRDTGTDEIAEVVGRIPRVAVTISTATVTH